MEGMSATSEMQGDADIQPIGTIFFFFLTAVLDNMSSYIQATGSEKKRSYNHMTLLHTC